MQYLTGKPFNVSMMANSRLDDECQGCHRKFNIFRSSIYGRLCEECYQEAKIKDALERAKKHIQAL